MSPYAIRGGSTVQPSWHSNLHFWPQTHDLWHIIRILVGFTVSGISHFSTMCFHRFSVGFPPFPVKYGDIPFIPQKISMFDANKISNKSPCCWNSQWNPMEITTFNASISSKKPWKNHEISMKTSKNSKKPAFWLVIWASPNGQGRCHGLRTPRQAQWRPPAGSAAARWGARRRAVGGPAPGVPEKNGDSHSHYYSI